MSQTLLRVKNLSKTYRSGAAALTVFSDATFDLDPGDCVAVIGESGSGKSTLLHLLATLDLPTKGEIFYRGRPLKAFTEEELAAYRNQEVGYVWQSYHLLPEFTALENVMLPDLIAGKSRGESEGPARRCLESVGLSGRETHRAGELSGGEQQRVAIARALVREPRVLLADEPTGNLDYQTAESVMDLLMRLTASQKLATVIATHNLSFARRCSRIFRIDNGRIGTNAHID
jgi:lipoprotein-releasing system ATP-binding protein